MAGAAGGQLAAAVTRGGGFAFVAGGHAPITNLKSEINKARESLQLKDGDPAPFGVGLMLWRLEASHGNPDDARPFLQLVLESRLKALWLSFSASPEAGGVTGWVNRVREMAKELGIHEDERPKLFVLVPTVKKALEAARLGVDVVVVQGTDSGGHGPDHIVGLPVHSLVEATQAAFRTLPSSPLLLAAGGITSGAQLVSILPFASGAVAGTAFLATPECLFNQAQKDLVVKSQASDTLRAMAWDYARNTLGWGENVDGRGIQNKTSASTEASLSSPEGRADYDKAVKAGDVSKIVTWSGTGVGQVVDGAGADVIVRRFEMEALATLDLLGSVKA
ncbi:inosine monophosphate dehydrogenase [Meredithblackwellia eburnea MCA 4105]